MTGADARIVQLLKEAREKLETERKRRAEPIAIIGMGCRFPGGASSPSAFWQVLVDGIDATNDVPADRWDAEALFDTDPNAPGKCYSKRGAFLAQIDGFEPEFFRISPREARGLDPQQRLLLEVTWEALEDSGIVPGSLRGSATGVWIGLGLDDYSRRCMPTGQLESIDAYNALGNARSVAAGRISYVLGLQGPALQLDTACSSSLVALHLACESLRSGETDLALVGGVSLMSSPEASVALSRLMALSPDGRCKTFDAAAAGYGRGEGCGIVVLKRLSAARAANDDIYAVVRGSATNHDGRSNGLTAPNGLAQEAVIRTAIANAGVAASAVSYVEAHGTGTPLGDPIEVMALSRVYGAGRSTDAPFFVGSVKTNVGHLEAAAGVAALIKVALTVAHGTLVPSLHFVDPNPKIPWASLPVRVITEVGAWPHHAGPRLAGVSSFGISGTNAHAIVEQAPELELVPPSPSRSAELIVLSARTEAGLHAVADRLRTHLRAQPDLALADLAYSLATTRAALEYGVALAVPTREALDEALGALSDNSKITPAVRSSGSTPKVAFIFPGQGSQWLGMGRRLLSEEPAFALAMSECDRAIRLETGWSVLGELQAPAESSRLEQVEVVQPVLFAVQVALAALWRSWGLEPDAVVGHSMGEIAAAHVCGALSLDDAVAVVCRRSMLLRRISGQGEMALVELSTSESAAALAGYEDRLAVAVSNSRHSTVLSGEPEALAAVLAKLDAQGIFCRRVKVDIASHSPQVDPLLEELAMLLENIEPLPSRIPMHSTVTAAVASGSNLTGDYWADNLRRPVCFAEVIEGLIAQGFERFIELSPHPLLVSAIEEALRLASASGVVVASLRREQPERLVLLQALGSLFSHGLPLDVARLFSNGGRRVRLPTYPWQRQRFWIEAANPLRSGTHTGHPLLGVRCAAAGVDAMYESVWSVQLHPWLADHKVLGLIVAPAAALLELARAAAQDYLEEARARVRELSIEQPLVIDGSAAYRVHCIIGEGGSRISIYSRAETASERAGWLLHAVGTVDHGASAQPTRLDLEEIRERCPETVDVARTYNAFGSVGIEYGPEFQGISRLWRGPRQALAELSAAASSESGFWVRPALLDAAMQAAAALFGAETARSFLPTELRGFESYRKISGLVLAHVTLHPAELENEVVFSLRIVDASGEVLASVQSITLRAASLATFKRRLAAASDGLFGIEWCASTLEQRPRDLKKRWRVIGEGVTARALVDSLRALGAQAELTSANQLASASPAEHWVSFWDVDPAVEEAARGALEGLALVRAAANEPEPPRIWWVTRSAQSVVLHEAVLPNAATLWGLARTVRQEHSELNCTLIDIDSADSLATILTREAVGADPETEVAWRGNQRFVPRLRRRKPLPGRSSSACTENWLDGTVLITGGLGGLGSEVARHLVRNGARHLVLLGRRGLQTAGAPELVADLAGMGADIVVAAVDVTDIAALTRVVDDIPMAWPLSGVIHAAAILDDGVIAGQTPERLERVLAVKVLGAWNLHLLTERRPIGGFVLFSSLASTLGSAGQSGYSAANAFLDALAAHRHARGLPGLSLAWGPWAERGLAAGLRASSKARLTGHGVGMLTTSQALALFDAAIGRPEPHQVLAALGPRLLAETWGRAVPALLHGLARPSAALSKGVTTLEWSEELAGLSSEDRMRHACDTVRAEVARILRIPAPSSVPIDLEIKDLGLDSLMALELRNALVRRTGEKLPAALVVRYPTVHAIARLLVAREQQTPSVRAEGRSRAIALCEGLKTFSAPQGRLFCFHDAGGSSALFEPFCAVGVDGLEVHAISHARLTPVDAAVAARYLMEAVDYIRALSDQPYCLFGHSLGGYFAWRVVQELERQNVRRAALFVPSASAFPQSIREAASEAELNDVFRLITRGRPHMETLKDDFSADARLFLALPKRDAVPLPIEIAAFVGKDDPIASESAMKVWADATTKNFSLTVLPGGHFYLSDPDARNRMLEQLVKRFALRRSPALPR